MTRRADERGVIAPSRLMLVAIVVVAIGAAMFFATSPKKDQAAAADSATNSAQKTPASSTPSSSAPASATPSTKPKPKPKASTTPAPAPAQPVDKATTRVAVFNNSGVKGLAKRTSDKVKAAGWQVTGAANWYGTIPSTTVYYPPQLKSAADSLAADLGVRRVMPAVKPMRDDRLTLILTTDYAG